MLRGYLPIFSKVRTPREGGRNNLGGGVGVYVDQRFDSEVIENLSLFIPGLIESIFLKVKLSATKYVIIGNIYRPPQSTIKLFNFHLNSILNEINSVTDKSMENLIITGDFNIDLLKINQNNDISSYLEIMLNNELFPTISKPTRINVNSATLIDHIFVRNIPQTSESGVFIRGGAKK